MGGAVSQHPLAKYPYYRSSFENHTRKYQSPYEISGGFSVLWLPSPPRHPQPLPRSQQYTPPAQPKVQQPQYQTSQQFQQQVHKEAQIPQQQTYEAFFAGLKSASRNTAGLASPLRQVQNGEQLDTSAFVDFGDL